MSGSIGKRISEPESPISRLKEYNQKIIDIENENHSPDCIGEYLLVPSKIIDTIQQDISWFSWRLRSLKKKIESDGLDWEAAAEDIDNVLLELEQ
jgi:hypothetical protein